MGIATSYRRIDLPQYIALFLGWLRAVTRAWRGFSGCMRVDHPLLAKLRGPIVEPFIAVISFVCLVGNIPQAAVLWNGRISFGSVVAFIFADLIVLAILDLCRKYYGLKMATFLLVTFYVAMSVGALIVESVFGALDLTRCSGRATRCARKRPMTFVTDEVAMRARRGPKWTSRSESALPDPPRARRWLRRHPP